MSMHILRPTLILVCLMLSAVTSEAARIYKSVDKEGNVVFTDVPPADQSGTVELKETNAFSDPANQENERRTRRQITRQFEEPVAPEPVVTMRYTSIAVSSPDPDEAIRENAGNLTVAVALSPELNVSANHQLEILIDGTTHATGTSTSVQLENIDRGTHQLVARVVDGNGQVTITSEPVTFHMLRHSALQRRAR